MKTLNFKFRSIKSELVEKDNKLANKTVLKLEFDRDSIEKHELSISIREIISHRSWIINFFLSFMIIIPLAALAYAIMKIGFNFKFDSSIVSMFIIISIISLITIWVVISIPSSIKNIKKDHVIIKRGKGNWKIIDEDKWEKFYRLLKITQEEESQF